MSLDPKSWLEFAKSLEVGQSRRFDHDCGSGGTLKCDHKPKGWGAWCWRCNDDGWVPHPEESFAERLARMTRAKVAEQEVIRTLKLPEPQEHDTSKWPLEARVWLYKIGMTNDDISVLGIYYCVRLQRVVIPIKDQRDALVFWQARSFDPERPKYINPLVDKSNVIPRFGTGKTIVLTEDILSAWKVGGVAPTISLLGTSLAQPLYARLLTERKPISIWLDPDAPGRKAANKIYQQLTSSGLDVRNIRSEVDPKLLTRQEIKDALSNQR